MGCDIHAHVEVKIRGKWEHWSVLYIRRDYDLFAKMAGVRNYDSIEPISEPRGVPLDMSTLTAMDANWWDSDGHSHSWLSKDEMRIVHSWYRLKYEDMSAGAWLSSERLFGYVFGNYPWDLDEEGCIPNEVEDVRVVFWFDN